MSTDIYYSIALDQPWKIRVLCSLEKTTSVRAEITLTLILPPGVRPGPTALNSPAIFD